MCVTKGASSSQSDNQLGTLLASQSVSQPASQSASRSASQSASQSVSQPVSEPASEPASQLVAMFATSSPPLHRLYLDVHACPVVELGDVVQADGHFRLSRLLLLCRAWKLRRQSSARATLRAVLFVCVMGFRILSITHTHTREHESAA